VTRGQAEEGVSELGPYFELRDGVFVLRPHARNPWSDAMLHGRLLAEPGRSAGRAVLRVRVAEVQLSAGLLAAPG
jgi:hypothetical protein